VVDVVCKIIDEFEKRITASEGRIAELERRLNKNSSNSSKPPSSDGLNRSNSMRPKNSGRKPGGQPGHPGQTLQSSESPDIKLLITEYLAQRKMCPHCGVLVSAGFPCGVTAPVQ
jgi:hypothetical protein